MRILRSLSSCQPEKKHPVKGAFSCMSYVRKPNSVCSYLSRITIARDLKRHFHLAADTALHSGKGLAVSPVCLHTIIPEGTPFLSDWTSLLAPRGLRRTGVTRYQTPYFRKGAHMQSVLLGSKEESSMHPSENKAMFGLSSSA